MNITKSNLQFIALFFLLLFATCSQGQNFEGVIRWIFTTEITDPNLKQNIDDAQKKASNPQTQAKIKEIEKQMSDPQFQKMLESNPQMKEQMMKMLEGMKNGNVGPGTAPRPPAGMEAMMPKSMTVKIKDGNTLTKMEGGMMAGEVLNLKGKDQTYYIQRESKTYSIIPNKKPGEEKSNAKVTKTNETKKILNYNCTKYIIESMDRRGRKITQNIWTTTDIKNIDFKSLTKQRISTDAMGIYYDGMEGVPLRIESKTPEINLTMEVADIKKEALNNADFTLPSDFKETKGF